MRISDWSSDVCSSDRGSRPVFRGGCAGAAAAPVDAASGPDDRRGFIYGGRHVASDTGSTFDSAAYGGPGWRGRTREHREEIGDLWAAAGIDSEYGRLRAVRRHRPGGELAAALEDPDSVPKTAPPEPRGAGAQEDALAREEWGVAGK